MWKELAFQTPIVDDTNANIIIESPAAQNRSSIIHVQEGDEKREEKEADR